MADESIKPSNSRSTGPVDRPGEDDGAANGLKRKRDHVEPSSKPRVASSSTISLHEPALGRQSWPMESPNAPPILSINTRTSKQSAFERRKARES